MDLVTLNNNRRKLRLYPLIIMPDPSTHCESCGCLFTAEDIDGGRCTTCGTMISAHHPKMISARHPKEMNMDHVNIEVEFRALAPTLASKAPATFAALVNNCNMLSSPAMPNAGAPEMLKKLIDLETSLVHLEQLRDAG